MKITNFTIINIFKTLDRFATKKLPQKISYAITKNIINLRNDCDCYEKELAKLFDRYKDKTIKDENGEPKFNQYHVPIIEAEYSKEFDEDLTELLNIEVEVDFYTIDDSVFNYDDTDKYDCLSPMEIMQLQDILCKPDKNPEGDN